MILMAAEASDSCGITPDIESLPHGPPAVQLSGCQLPRPLHRSEFWPVRQYKPGPTRRQQTQHRTHLPAVPWKSHEEYAALDFGRVGRPCCLAAGQNKFLTTLEEFDFARRNLECRHIVNGIGRNEALVERKFRQVIKNAHGVSACGARSTKFHVDMMGSDKERSASGIDDER